MITNSGIEQEREKAPLAEPLPETLSRAECLVMQKPFQASLNSLITEVAAWIHSADGAAFNATPTMASPGLLHVA